MGLFDFISKFKNTKNGVKLAKILNGFTPFFHNLVKIYMQAM